MKQKLPIRSVKDIQNKARVTIASNPERKHNTIVIKLLLTFFAVAFTILAYFASITPYFQLDLSITHFIQKANNPLFSIIMQLISYIGFTPQSFIIVLAITGLLLSIGLRWEALVGFVNAASVTVINIAIKTLVHRQRPSVDLVNVFAHLKDYSFPSGHVMFYTSFFGYLFVITYILMRKGWVKNSVLLFFALLVLLIGPSRIYLGQHWASDVLGAYLFATIWLVLSIYVYEWGKKRYFVHQPIAPTAEKKAK